MCMTKKEKEILRKSGYCDEKKISAMIKLNKKSKKIKPVKAWMKTKNGVLFFRIYKTKKVAKWSAGKGVHIIPFFLIPIKK